MAMLTAHGVSHRGRVRSSNEDAWLSLIDLGPVSYTHLTLPTISSV